MTDRLLNSKEVRLALGGLANSTLYRHIKTEPGFPQPVKVGMLTRFRQSDLDTYLDEISARARTADDDEFA